LRARFDFARCPFDRGALHGLKALLFQALAFGLKRFQTQSRCALLLGGATSLLGDFGDECLLLFAAALGFSRLALYALSFCFVQALERKQQRALA
jgi:hypothetical protein